MIKTKPFSICKHSVYKAYLMVQSNKGVGGVDGVSLKEFHADYKNSLYRLWNRLSSGSYMPPPVKLVEIPKKDGNKRPLGIPTVADRIAQTLVKELLELDLEALFHKDSFGYRKGKSAHDAIAKARQLCWRYDWVIDLDIKGFFDNIPHELLMKAVRKHCDCKWMLLYIERWLVAPLQLADGTIVARTKGVPQGSVIGPLLANLYLHYCLDIWLSKHYPNCSFERYADDIIIHCGSRGFGVLLLRAIEHRLQECGLEMHPLKTKLVYCKCDHGMKEENASFEFLGYTFKPRLAHNSKRHKLFCSFLPAVSCKAMKSMNETIKGWKSFLDVRITIQEIAGRINPVLRGWIYYYGKFYRSRLKQFMHIVNLNLTRWVQRKYKKYRASKLKAIRWIRDVSLREPNLFAHWTLLGVRPMVG